MNDAFVRYDGFFRTLRINCLVDVEVFDDDGKRVAIMTDSEFERDIIAIVDGKEKILELPPDMGYTVKITATEDRLMTYLVIEEELDNDPSRAVLYFQIEIKKGEVYTGSVPVFSRQDYNIARHGTKISYTLTDPSGQLITPTSDGNPEEIMYAFDVTANDFSLGDVLNTRGVYKGHHAFAGAYPNSNAVFDGWYENGVKLEGVEPLFDFILERNRELTAHFKKKQRRGLSSSLEIPSDSGISLGSTKPKAEEVDESEKIVIGNMSFKASTKELRFEEDRK